MDDPHYQEDLHNHEKNAEAMDAVKMIMDELKSLHAKQDKVYLTNIPISLTLCLILFCVYRHLRCLSKSLKQDSSPK